MRKPTRRPSSPSKLPRKRVLQLSQETVRTLTPNELSDVVTGCPTGSDTLQQGASHTC